MRNEEGGAAVRRPPRAAHRPEPASPAPPGGNLDGTTGSRTAADHGPASRGRPMRHHAPPASCSSRSSRLGRPATSGPRSLGRRPCPSGILHGAGGPPAGSTRSPPRADTRALDLPAAGFRSYCPYIPYIPYVLHTPHVPCVTYITYAMNAASCRTLVPHPVRRVPLCAYGIRLTSKGNFRGVPAWTVEGHRPVRP